MTTEEKARRYDEALEKARIFKEHLIEINQKDFADEMEYIFPELTESEDERIRKEIISALKYANHEGVYNKHLAWLEKQGEQKPYGQRQECVDCQFNYAGKCKGYCTMKKDEQKSADKVEPKFKLEHGKWYRCILTPVVHKHFTVGKVYKCELEGCLVDDINEDRIVDLDLECFRPATEDEIPQEKSEVKVAISDLETLQDPILIRLDRIYDLLLEIRNNNMSRQPYIETYPPYPYHIQPWYDTSKVYCDKASTETTTNTIEDERPETNM